MKYKPKKNNPAINAAAFPMVKVKTMLIVIATLTHKMPVIRHKNRNIRILSELKKVFSIVITDILYHLPKKIQFFLRQ